MKQKVKLGLAFVILIPINSGKIIVDGLVVKSELRLGGVFQHKIGTKLTSIDVKLFMRGMWRNAFGSNWFAIGNIYLA